LYRILAVKTLAANVHEFKIQAPGIAKKARAGQFVIVRLDEKGERIPLTLADWDASDGSVTLVFQQVGATTNMMAQLKAGDSIMDIVGPLGQASEIEKFGTVVCVAGGVGVAPVTPIAAALKRAGNRVISIMGARNKDLIFWEERLKAVSDELIVTTDDGSYGRKDLVTAPLKELLENGGIARVIAIGPGIMMKFASQTTKPFGVKTVVSLNTIMVDGTGMCGCCRASVGGKTQFACVDGPEFDGHEVDWELVASRQRTYVAEEQRAVKQCRCANK
jgi:NAD(P)H-flavin reductase